MLRLILVVGAFISVSCQDSKSCCCPKQWEGLQAGQGGFVAAGKPQVMTSVTMVAFDAVGKRVFAFANTTAGTVVTSQKIYQDFNTNYQYIVDIKKQTCAKTKITKPFNNGCIPDDARFFGNYIIGVKGESLNIKSYGVHMAESGNALDVAISVTENLCVPVSEIVVGSANNVPLALTYGFTDITPGIRDPSVFKLPSICVKNATSEVPFGHTDHSFKIFSV